MNRSKTKITTAHAKKVSIVDQSLNDMEEDGLVSIGVTDPLDLDGTNSLINTGKKSTASNITA